MVIEVVTVPSDSEIVYQVPKVLQAQLRLLRAIASNSDRQCRSVMLWSDSDYPVGSGLKPHFVRSVLTITIPVTSDSETTRGSSGMMVIVLGWLLVMVITAIAELDGAFWSATSDSEHY